MEPLVANTSLDSDDDDLGIPPPPPPMPPHSHDHEAGGSSVVSHVAPPAIDIALTSILQSLTQRHSDLAVEKARQVAIQQQLSERMLSILQTILDGWDTLQQQLLADRTKHRAFMTHILQHIGVPVPPVQSATPHLFRLQWCQPSSQGLSCTLLV
jgi:hypothetical protein